MTKAAFNPKVSTVERREEKTPPPDTKKNLKSQEVKGTTYSEEGRNEFKAIISGNKLKAQDTPVGELVEELAAAETQYARSPVQQYFASFLFGTLGTPKPSPEEIDVPSFDAIKRENPDIFEKASVAEGFVERYESLIDLISGTMLSIKRTLDADNASGMTGEEIKNLQAYLKECEDKLFLCNQELARAKEQHSKTLDFERKEREEKLAGMTSVWWDE